ncbi:MAG: hypothetical protein L3J51_03340 [Cocleimonas sp.]|nr:hypothetical protein [Cocleimonas sp.]
MPMWVNFGCSLTYYAKNDAQGNIGKLRAITRESLLGLKQENIIFEIDNTTLDGQSGFISHNGVQSKYIYRKDGQLKSIQIVNSLKLQYSYDENGNIKGIDENGTLQNYKFEQDRLTFADTLTGSYQYNYDKLGNRISETHENNNNKITNTYQYPKEGQGNRIISTSNKTTEIKHQYNEHGSPVNTTGFIYIYNADQRPIRVYKKEADRKIEVAQYSYNAFGERVKKTTYSNGNKPKVTYFLYDEQAIIAEANSNGEITNQYIYFDKKPIAKLEGNNIYAIHNDNLGTPKLVTNDKKENVWKAGHSPFGKAEIEIQIITLNLRLPGQYADQETGTHYNYLRDYDPQSGRYITSDPIGLAGGINTYSYAYQNPTKYIDRDGRVAFVLVPLIPVAVEGLTVAKVFFSAAVLSAGIAITAHNNATRPYEIIYDPNKPIGPQLPGWIDPWSLKAITVQPSCDPELPPEDPRERCIKKADSKYLECLLTSPSTAKKWMCRATKALRLFACSYRRSDGDDG